MLTCFQEQERQVKLVRKYVCGEADREKEKAVKLCSCSIALSLFDIVDRSKVQTLPDFCQIQVFPHLKFCKGRT